MKIGHWETLGNTFCGDFFKYIRLSSLWDGFCRGAHQQLNGFGITQVLFQVYNSDMEGLQRNWESNSFSITKSRMQFQNTKTPQCWFVTLTQSHWDALGNHNSWQMHILCAKAYQMWSSYVQQKQKWISCVIWHANSFCEPAGSRPSHV